MMTVTREKRWLGIHSPVLTMQRVITALLLVSSLDAVAGSTTNWGTDTPDLGSTENLTTTQLTQEKKKKGPKNFKKNKPPTPTSAPPSLRPSTSPSVAPSSNPTAVGWAPDPAFYGTYKTNMNVTVILERTTITVSYQCLPKWSTYVYVYIVDFGLPLNTTASEPLVGDGFSAIGYLNSSNTTAPLDYARFDFVTETETYIHWYCDGDYDQLSSSDAINNDVADVTNLTAGCGTGDYPWAPLLASDGTC